MQWLRIAFIGVPALVIVLLGRSCTGSTSSDRATDRPARVVFAAMLASPGVGTAIERAGLTAELRRASVIALLPSAPSPDPALRGGGRVRIEEFAGEATFLYTIGPRTNPSLMAATSTETRICQPQSVIEWSTVAIGSGDGCVAANPGGGFFVEWIDRSAKPDIGVHVEAIATDENRLLAWLSTWARQPR